METGEAAIHEVGIAQQIVQLAEQAARRHGLTTIREIEVEVGPLSGVNLESLRFAFEVVRRGTLAAEAVLTVRTAPLVLRCRNCQSEYAAEPDDLACPVCEQEAVEVLQGREMVLRAVCGDPPL